MLVVVRSDTKVEAGKVCRSGPEQSRGACPTRRPDLLSLRRELDRVAFPEERLPYRAALAGGGSRSLR